MKRKTIYWGAYSIKNETHSSYSGPLAGLESVSKVTFLADNTIGRKITEKWPWMLAL